MDWFQKDGLPENNGEGSDSARTPKRDRLTLSMNDDIKDAAKSYAEKHGTSVSALVEAFLGQLANEGSFPRRRATAEEVGKLTGRVLTGGAFAAAKGLAEAAGAYFENGTLLIDEDDPLSPPSIQLRAILRSQKLEIKTELLVSRDIIAKVNRTGTRVSAMEVAQADFLAIVAETACQRATDLHFSVHRFETTLDARRDGQMTQVRTFPSSQGAELCAAAFNMADASDASYRPLEYQGARISAVRNPLPKGIQSLKLQFSPLPDSGRYMHCRITYSGTEATGGFSDLASLGFTDHQKSSIRDAARLRTGLCLVSGWRNSGLSTTMRTVFGTSKAGEAKGRNFVLVEDPPAVPVSGVAQLPVLNATTDEERNEKYRQAISAALRTDADVIGIGEIRDKASASLSLAAAMSGIQVWGSLQANNAMSALWRFQTMSNTPARALSMGGFPITVIWQHLLRKPCPACSVSAADYTGHRGDWLRCRLEKALIDVKEVLVPVASDCTACGGRGISGRVLVAEIFQPTDRELAKCPPEYAEDASPHGGFSYYRSAGLHAARLVSEGTADPFDAFATFGRISLEEKTPAGR